MEELLKLDAKNSNAHSFFNRIEDYERYSSSDLLLVVLFLGAIVLATIAKAIWGFWEIYDSWQNAKGNINKFDGFVASA